MSSGTAGRVESAADGSDPPSLAWRTPSVDQPAVPLWCFYFEGLGLRLGGVYPDGGRFPCFSSCCVFETRALRPGLVSVGAGCRLGGLPVHGAVHVGSPHCPCLLPSRSRGCCSPEHRGFASCRFADRDGLSRANPPPQTSGTPLSFPPRCRVHPRSQSGERLRISVPAIRKILLFLKSIWLFWFGLCGFCSIQPGTQISGVRASRQQPPRVFFSWWKGWCLRRTEGGLGASSHRGGGEALPSSRRTRPCCFPTETASATPLLPPRGAFPPLKKRALRLRGDVAWCCGGRRP